MKTRKYWKYLFWLGSILCIVGLVAALVSGSWSLLPVGLLVAGIVIIVLWLGFLGRFTQGFWRKRSTQVGTNALIATLAMLVIAGLINFLAVRYAVRVDLTENQLYTLSTQSQQIVENLQQPLQVWVFDPNPNPADRELLENYRRNRSNFEFEFVDPQIQVGLAQEFNVQSPGEVYLEYGNKQQLVQTVSQVESLSEVQLTNAIEKIQRDRVEIVYFLQGHGEAQLEAVEGGLSQAVTSLEEKGYTVESLTLATTSEVPEDAAVVVVAGPRQELFEGEVEALQDYLDAGGNLLLMLDPETNPGLEPLLDEWGVQLNDRLVIDASGSGSVVGLGPAVPIVTDYTTHPITEDFIGNGISFYPLAQPIDTTEVEGIDATALLITNEQSWAESNPEAEEIEFDPAEDIRGPLDLGVALTREESDLKRQTESEGNQQEEGAADTSESSPSPTPTESEENQQEAEDSESPPAPSSEKQLESEDNQEQERQKSPEARLVVVGNSTFATDGLFGQQLNGDVFLNSVNWLANAGEQTLSIRPKEPENRRINLTPVQAGIIGWAAMLIVPLLGLLAAGVMWWRRR